MTPAANPKVAEAAQRQAEAADPSISTWTSANAGSGKTRVLTDRVARLLLADAPPQNILCLTYTKAAASEMQNRLFQRLGEWAMAPDHALAATLDSLEVATAHSPDTLAKARRLFARAIETPGGLKIQTIHAFCAGLLRRFPLEAGISPAFTELDETEGQRLRAEVLAELAEVAPALVEAVAETLGDDTLDPLCLDILSHRAAFTAPFDHAAVSSALGAPANASPADLRMSAIASIEPASLLAMADVFDTQSASMQAIAPTLRGIADLLAEPDAADAAFEALCGVVLVKARTHANSKVPTKNARTALGAHAEKWDRLAAALLAAVDAERAWAAADAAAALHRFAARFLAAYEEAKTLRSLLDFDDLIARTEALLARPGVADWVLYKLDGGIDHVLVDEAQDTAPAQWRVIDLLTREFTAGAGTHAPGTRSLFVVGDFKQSIYSFQGADPVGFANEREAYRARFDAIGQRLLDIDLEYSFRSAPEILAAVDQTFAEGNRVGLGDYIPHRAIHTGRPGRVDLWPIVAPEEADEPAPWYQPVDMLGAEHHTARLAGQVADACRKIVDTAQLPEGDGAGGGARPATAGDILILVRSRGRLFHEIIRRCKGRGLDVAGADVLKLGEELAVRDLTALLSFLDTPEDSLSLAAALRSPLLGWSEADLYDLAATRDEEFLWPALRRRREEFPATSAMLDDLRGAADFLRPYELLERILSRHDGRRRLIARIGAEAADGIDALLARALAYEQRAIPSLTGFLAAQEDSAAKVKRQAEGRGRKLRVMTVHGAKGLQAPIVILPDCGPQQSGGHKSDRILLDDEGRALRAVSADAAPALMRDMKDRAKAARAAEERRLLYVAMTRAESWLIAGAAGKLGSSGETWYDQIRDGLERAGAVSGEGPGELSFAAPHWPPPQSRPATIDSGETPARPAWMAAVPPEPRRPARPLAPSGLGGAKALPGEGLGEAQVLARGTRIHALLEHLPGAPEDRWDELAAALFAPDAPRAEVSAADLAADLAEDLAEARAILKDPHLAPLFAPDTLAEVAVSAALPALGDRRLSGTIDRLLVAPDCVRAVDFKTNAQIPDRPEATPEGLLRQMGAYAAALAQVYPDHRIETAILWTRTPLLMPLPEHLTEAALARAAAEPDLDATRHRS